MDISGEARELRKVAILDKSVKHRKECQNCTKQALCDEAVQINMDLLILSI